MQGDKNGMEKLKNNFFEIMKAVVQTVFYMKPVLKILRNYKKNNRFLWLPNIKFVNGNGL